MFSCWGPNIAAKAPDHEDSWMAPSDTWAKGKHWGCEKNFERVPPVAVQGPQSEVVTPPQTLCSLFEMAAVTCPETIMLAVERVDGKTPPVTKDAEGKPSAIALPRDEWTSWTYARGKDDVKQFAKSLLSIGFEQHNAVSTYGFNSPEVVLAFWGTLFAGGKANGIYPTDTPAQVQYKLAHSTSEVVLVEDVEKYNIVKGIHNQVNCLKAIVIWGEAKPEDHCGDKKVYTWSEFLALGAAVSDEDLLKRKDLIRVGHCAALVYTSGTTGNPKAVMLSHDAFSVTGYALVRELVAKQKALEHRVMSYLPLSHVAGMVCDILQPTAATASGKPFSVYFARKYDIKQSTITARLQCIQPTSFLAVPMVYQKIMEKMQAVGATITGAKRAVADYAKGLSEDYYSNCQVGGDGAASPMLGMMDSLILRMVRGRLGLDHCEVAITGAAPMPPHIYRYFASLGIRICEVYGMSESCGLTTNNMPSCYLWGSVGFATPGVEVKCFRVSETNLTDKKECPRTADFNDPTEAEQGEICFRGRTIMMGYLSNPSMGDREEINKKTAEAIDQEGWLHSGDKGCVGEHGMVKITGRYKELIMGTGGENIAPVPIEDNWKKMCKGISNCMMIGDKRKYNTMVVTLKCEGANGESAGSDQLMPICLGISADSKTLAQAKVDPKWKDAIDAAMKATNDNPLIAHNNTWKVQKWIILGRDFCVEDGEFTPTMKLKRSEAVKHFAAEIETMYT